jgi:hypothetical protein
MKYKSTFLFILVAAFMHAQTQRVIIRGGVPVVSSDGSHMAFLSNRGDAEEPAKSPCSLRVLLYFSFASPVRLFILSTKA